MAAGHDPDAGALAMARVLLVDDDPRVLQIVRLRLERQGHHVSTADSGRAAMEALLQHWIPDVVVLDVTLPDTSGFDLLETIRAIDGLGSLPAVFLSARSDPEVMARGLALGAAYLTKPFVASVIFRAIDSALAHALES